MIDLLGIASQCTLCAVQLPLGAKPVFSASKLSRILIVGQAPGRPSTPLEFPEMIKVDQI